MALTLIRLTTQVVDILPVANGGTGASTLSGAGVVQTSRTISTTAPLTGGGDLSANRTLDISNFVGDSGSGGTKGAVPAPASGDAAANKFLKANGSWATTPGSVNFADAETPSGSINSSNVTFTLANTPSPGASLMLHLNGQLQKAGGADYSLSTATITMTAAPTTGDVLLAFYRY